MPDRIIVIDDQADVRDYITKVLGRHGFETLGFASGEEALRHVESQRESIDLIILDHDLGPGRMDGLEVLDHLRDEAAELPVIMLTGKATVDLATQAMKRGARDFLEKDLYIDRQLELSVRKIHDLIKVVNENRRLRRECQVLRRQADAQRDEGLRRYRMVGSSGAFQDLLEKCRKLAAIPRPVLICGERGTGKELVAAAIHYLGPRAEGAFVKVNCAAFSGSLLESEMFGHEKGAFTGSDQTRKGRFELADGGTLFLDEIGNMPLDFQEKILRVIEYQEFERVGASRTIAVDVRVLAATNADLTAAIAAGSFRADLYDRLAFEVVRVPPLSERPGDVPALVEHFAARLRDEVPSIPRTEFTPGALATLSAARWPGNVRELKNVVERLIYAADGAPIEECQLPPEMRAGTDPRPPAADQGFDGQVLRFEQRLLRAALESAGWNQKKAAGALGLSYDQFRHYYKKHDLASEARV